jgi:opacity protein-like surface antigen
MKRILLVLLMLVAVMPLAMAASVDPVIEDKWKSGNAEFECSQTECDSDFAYKIDEWNEENGMDGVYSHAGNNITITNSDGATFNWESEYPVCAVIVKAGTGAYIYYYDDATSDTVLTAPEGKDISHVTFCFSEEEDDGGIEEIPEFPTVALPIAAILGLAFFMQRRKE